MTNSTTRVFYNRELYKTLFLCILVASSFSALSQSGVSFNSSLLKNVQLASPTTMAFGPDNRLYVTQQDGTIFAYTIQKNGPNDYHVVTINTEVITLVKSIPNHNDRGELMSIIDDRQITGILAVGTATNPVLYICSSDPRIGGGGELGDLDLDTNSGTISKLTKNGSTWTKVDLVRGLPRSEENHAPNGLVLDEVNNILYVAQGGNTNAGSPCNNFAFLTEYALSAAVLKIDLAQIQTQFGGAYTLPTLDDPTRSNVAGGGDVNDPYGGNDGRNQAKLVPGGPVQIYSPGYRNIFDLVVTKTPGKSGRMYTIDNGANGGWGGFPENEGQPNVTNNYIPGEPGSNGPGLHDDKVNNLDNLHFITGQGYYGGHPNPLHANPAGAGLYWFDNATGIAHYEMNPTPDWPPYPVSMANPVEADFRNPGVNDGALYTWTASTNGLAEYTSTAYFNGAMAGNLLTASFDGKIYRIELNQAGTAVTQVTPIFSGFGVTPLDVIAQGDGDIFGGTIWALTYSGNIAVFEPISTPGPCTGNNNNFSLDDDGDGYSNGDETANGTNPCSPASKPTDFDFDLISDLTDPDDDNDGFTDNLDKFALDVNNGLGTQIPLDYPFLNGNPGFGLFGVGTTGLMTNYVDNYANNFDPDDPDVIVGGAVGVLSFPAQPGDAVTNNQKYAFQFGIAVDETTSHFTLQSRLLGAPFFEGASGQQLGTQSEGIYFGTGDQDNYLKLVLHANSGNPGFQILCEQNGVIVNQQMIPVADILNSSTLDLYIDVNPHTGLVKCQYQKGIAAAVDVGQPFTVSGNLLTMLLSHQAVAVGVIASSGNKAPYSALWDYMKISRASLVENILNINSGGPGQQYGSEVWVTDQAYTAGGGTYSAVVPISNTTKDELYQTERWGNFTYQIPVPQSGQYYVDLHFAEIYYGVFNVQGAGSRVFNVNVENGQFVLNNFDILQNNQPAQAVVMRSSDLTVTDGFITITLTGIVDGAKISGVSVFRYLTGGPPANTPPFVVQAYPNQSVPSTQTSLVVPLNQVFNDDNGVQNLTFSVPNISNASLVSATQINGTQLTLTLTGTIGTTTVTLRATDASNASVESTFQLQVTAPTPTPPVVVQPYPNQSVPSTQTSLVVPLNQIFNDDNGVQNLIFTVPNISTPGIVSGTQINGTQLTLSLTGTVGTTTITMRATDAGNAFVESSFQLQVVASNPDPVVSIIRINAGGTAQQFGTEAWVADQYFTGGNSYSSSTAIGNTTQDQIYQSERYGNFQYHIPVPSSGTYFVDLHFAEIYFNTTGSRVFNVNVENGQFVRSNLDIVQAAGGSAQALVIRADNLNVTDGMIDIVFTSVVENPKVSGIAVSKYNSAPPANTPPFVVQAYPNQSVPSTQTSLVVPLNQIFNDDNGVQNLTFSVPSISNASLVSGTQINGTQLTLSLTGTAGTATVTLRATDASNAFVESSFQLQVTASNPNPDPIVSIIRINAGGTAQQFGTEAWVADQYFAGGSAYSSGTAIGNTTQDQIYQSERYGTFQYHIPVPSSGTYLVDLHFAEIYFSAVGSRVFNVNVENGQFVRNNLDIVQAAGGMAQALIIRADNLNITDGMIDISFTSVTENPKVSGIAVSKYNAAPPANTPPVVIQAYPNQSVLSTQASLVVPLNQVFNDDGGVQNLTFTVPNISNASVVSAAQISGTQLTLTLTGTVGTTTITMRATDGSNAFVESSFQLQVTAPAPNPNPVTNVIRINSGGPALQFGTEAWVADQYFTGGQTWNNPGPIGNTTQDQIYQTERYGNFQYHIPVTGNGTYLVDLHFADTYFSSVGARLLNVNVENGQFVRTNLDIIQAAGGGAQALIVRADNLNVTDGFIDIVFTGVVDNANITGVAVSKYTATQTSASARQVNASVPVLTNPGDVTLYEGRAWNYRVMASDPSGGRLMYASENLPASLVLNPTTGVISGTIEDNAGVFPVTLSVTNLSGLSSHTDFILTVKENSEVLTLKEPSSQIVLYPNPTENKKFTVKIDVKQESTWNFVLIDFTGRQISLGSHELPVGIGVVEFDLEPHQIGTGMYYMSAANNFFEKSVIKVVVK